MEAVNSPKPMKTVIAQLEQQLTKPPPIATKPTTTPATTARPVPVARSTSQPKVAAAAAAVAAAAKSSTVSKSASAVTPTTTGPVKKWQPPSSQQSPSTTAGVKPSIPTAAVLRPVSNRDIKTKPAENATTPDGPQKRSTPTPSRTSDQTDPTPGQPPWLAQIKARKSSLLAEKNNEKTNNVNTTNGKPTIEARNIANSTADLTDAAGAAGLQPPAAVDDTPLPAAAAGAADDAPARYKDVDDKPADDTTITDEKLDALAEEQPQKQIVVSVGGKSYRRLPVPDPTGGDTYARNAKPPRKPAKPPAVDLSVYKYDKKQQQQQQQLPGRVGANVRHQTNAEEDPDDIYDDVDITTASGSATVRPMSTVSRISEFTEEEEIGLQRHASHGDGEIYDDIGQGENGFVDEEIYSELD